MEKILLSPGSFDLLQGPGWYRVALGGNLVLDFYYKPSKHRNAVVFSPGWIDRSKYGHPYFQRMKWLVEFEGVGICLADPCLNLAEEIQIAWFLGTSEHDYLKDISAYLGRLMAHLGIDTRHVTFFGSSAGGFSSMAFASHMKGARAFAVNPQTEILSFHNVNELAKIIRIGFGATNSTALMKRMPWRFSLRALFEKNGCIPRSLIWINTVDEWHMERHILPLLEGFSGSDGVAAVDVRFYANSAEGHNPPGPDVLIPVLKRFHQDEDA